MSEPAMSAGFFRFKVPTKFWQKAYLSSLIVLCIQAIYNLLSLELRKKNLCMLFAATLINDKMALARHRRKNGSPADV